MADTKVTADTEPTTVQFTICPYGDLQLCLKTSAINATYLVSSHQLCYASPVFRARIPPSPGRGSSEIIDLRRLRAATPSDSNNSSSLYEMDIEDNLGIAPIIMAVMLYVIHGRAEHIPETITFENLIDIAVICDHYRCGDTISPWDKVWMKQPKLEKLVLLPAYLDWLFIAHVFRNQELFGKITKELARNVVRTEDGKFGVMIGGDVRKMHNRLPEEIIYDMANEHAKAVKDIIRVCHQTYDMYQDDSTVWCKHGQEYCDRIVFAFLHMELSELGLLEKENMHRKQPDIQGNRSFDSTVDNFKNLWTSIRQNLGNVTVDGIHHLDCIEPAEEKVKMFDPCLGNIASLTLESYQHFGVVKWWSVLPDDIDIKPPYARTDRCAYVVICPYGDLEIYYSSLGIAFRVSSHAVRTASPILRHLLERACGFLTQSRRMQDLSYYSIQRHKLTIDEAYNPVVLSVVFYALHGLGKKIPHKIDCEHLYDLAVLCEKYQCASIMLPWCLCWIEGLRQTLDRPMDGKWLYIAWVFGLDDIFQTLTRWFTANAFTEGYGDFLIIEDKQHIIALGKHIPREILWKISEHESNIRMKIADVCMSLYERYCNPSADECLQSRITVTAKLCSRLIFANIHLGFKSINLLKGNNIQIPTRVPLMTIARDINKMLSAMDSISRITGTDKIDHSSCLGYVKDTNKRVQMILDEMTLDLAMCGWKKE